MRSDCRGDARNTSAPNRAMSYRDADAAIISMAQQARPNPIGQMDDSRAQFSTRSMLVVMKLSSNRWSIKPIEVIVPVSVDKRRPVDRRLVERVNGLDRTGRHAGPAIDTLVGVNIEHFCRGEGRLVLSGMDTVDRADVHAGCILRPDARLADDIGQRS